MFRLAESDSTYSAPPSPADPGLPGPERRGHGDLLIFDGQCRICTASMRGLNRWDWCNKLAFLSLHDPQVREICPDLSHDELMREIYLLDSRGRRYRGIKAIRVAAGRVPVLWPIVPLLYLPGTLPLWSAAYRAFARWRYRFGRRDDCPGGSCSVHFDPPSARSQSPDGASRAVDAEVISFEIKRPGGCASVDISSSWTRSSPTNL